MRELQTAFGFKSWFFASKFFSFQVSLDDANISLFLFMIPRFKIITLNTNAILFIAFILLLISLSGCYQIHSDDDLRTVPVTNNPNVVQQAGGVRIPGMGI